MCRAVRLTSGNDLSGEHHERTDEEKLATTETVDSKETTASEEPGQDWSIEWWTRRIARSQSRARGSFEFAPGKEKIVDSREGSSDVTGTIIERRTSDGGMKESSDRDGTDLRMS